MSARLRSAVNMRASRDVSMKSPHSEKCPLEAFWKESEERCVLCQERFGRKKGNEFSSNCGFSDDGGRHEGVYKECSAGTFNDGNYLKCQLCTPCPSSLLLKPCNSSTDVLCCSKGKYAYKGECKDEVQPTSALHTCVGVVLCVCVCVCVCCIVLLAYWLPENSLPPKHIQPTEFHVPKLNYHEKLTLNYIRTTTGYSETFKPVNSTPDTQTSINHHAAWLGLAVVSALLCVCLVSLICMTKKRKQCFKDGCEHIRLSNTDDSKNVNELLPLGIQDAPLPVVLNHLDVVEELVLLLDPDTPGVKNTRHLAASCSISFTWINYAYSMKDSRSPLIAVLEKIIANYPDWTVGHLAALLSKIGRNDAVAVLRKLVVNKQETFQV